jgi:hypothetical protein
VRLPILLLTAAFATATAAAQDAPPPEPDARAAPNTGLSDLNQTLNGLQDQPAEAEQAPPAQSSEEPSAEPDEADEDAAPDQAAPAQEPPAEATDEAGESAAPPAATGAPGTPLTREQTARLARAVARGRQMTAIARAGLVGTQDMLAHVSDPDGAGIDGWVAEPQGNAMLVTFYAGEDADRKAVYRVNVLGTRAVSRETYLEPAERPSLTPAQARLARARAATDGLDHRPCAGQVFNVLVIPPVAVNAPIDVYQLSPQTERGHYPLGGDFVTRVSSEGEVMDSHALAETCTDVTPPAIAPGTPPAPIAVDETIDSLPNELHVFFALWTGHPLAVSASRRSWRVTGESIIEAQ